MFSISEQYSLELHWDKALFEQEGICKLEGALFSGPALAQAAEISSNDSIRVDFYSQYIHLVRTPYVANLKWGQVIYDNKVVRLEDCYLQHLGELNNVPQLKNTDWLLIDTSNHEESVHQFNLVYKSYVMTKDKDLYKFKVN